MSSKSSQIAKFYHTVHVTLIFFLGTLANIITFHSQQSSYTTHRARTHTHCTASIFIIFPAPLLLLLLPFSLPVYPFVRPGTYGYCSWRRGKGNELSCIGGTEEREREGKSLSEVSARYPIHKRPAI